MAAAPVKPYEGREPYIFISYSHRDSDRVFPILKHLDAKGYRLWYDEGIDPGTEWPESIAQHLMHSAVCLAFVSDNSLASQNCRREINFALSRNQIGFLSVMLEDAKMSPGVELQLSTYQSLLMYKYSSQEEFFEKLTNVDLLEPCKRPKETAAPQVTAAEAAPAAPVKEPQTVKEQKPAKEPRPAKEKAEKTDKGGKNNKPLIIGGAAVAVIAIIVAIVMMTSGKSGGETTTAAPTKEAQESQTAATKAQEQTEPAETETEAQTEPEAPIELSDNLNDFTFKLDDVVYQLPFSLSKLTENGWTISASGVTDQSEVEAGSEEVFTMARNGAEITVTAVNLDKEAKAMADCKIGSVEVEQGDILDAGRFCVAKGITVFSSENEVAEAFGKGAGLSTYNNYRKLTYGFAEGHYTCFEFYQDSEKYNTVTVVNYPAGKQAERLTELSDDLEDYTFKLDDVVYQLPFAFPELTAGGWTISTKGTSDQTKVKGNSDMYLEVSKNGATVTVYAVNASGSARPLGECLIGGIEILQNEFQDASRFCTSKGITLSSTENEIISAFGESEDVNEYSQYKVINYAGKYSRNRVSFMVYEKDTKFNRVKMFNYPTEPEYTETVEEVPEYLASYAAPAALGDALFSGILELDGALYQLPAPVSEFLNNGWEFYSKPGFLVAGGTDSVTLCKGEQKFNARVMNFSEVQTLTENCAVSEIDADAKTLGSCRLPQGVEFGTAKTAVDALSTEFYTNEYSDYYYYNTMDKETNVSLGIRIGKESQKIELIRLEHTDWNY